MLVPTMIYALLDHPRFGEFDLSSLETIFYGASAISPGRLKEAIERIGPVFSQFYGQAEAPMAVTLLRKHEHDVNDMTRLARRSEEHTSKLQSIMSIPYDGL